MAELSLQLAGPEHGEIAAALIIATGRPIFAYMFGDQGEAERQVALQWPGDGGLFSHRNATAAQMDGELVGIEIGFSKAQEEGLLPDTVSAFQRHTAAEDLLPLLLRGRTQSYLSPVIPEDAYFMQSLAVIPEGRGRGWGRILLQNAFDAARKAGFLELQLDVLSDNPALSFYLANGMEQRIETRLPELAEHHGIATMYRMAKRL